MTRDGTTYRTYELSDKTVRIIEALSYNTQHKKYEVIEAAIKFSYLMYKKCPEKYKEMQKMMSRLDESEITIDDVQGKLDDFVNIIVEDELLLCDLR